MLSPDFDRNLVSPTSDQFAASDALRPLAHRLIPGGAHTYAKGDDQYPLLAPGFIARGSGCHVWDVDGNAFIEYGMDCGPLRLAMPFRRSLPQLSSRYGRASISPGRRRWRWSAPKIFSKSCPARRWPSSQKTVRLQQQRPFALRGPIQVATSSRSALTIHFTPTMTGRLECRRWMPVSRRM